MKQRQSPATHAPAGNKMTYTPPQMEVIKMDLEGSVMSASQPYGFREWWQWGKPLPKQQRPPQLQLRIGQRTGRPDKRHPHRGAITKTNNHPKRKETKP